MSDTEKKPLLRWLLGEMLTTTFFKNTITLQIVLTYCYLVATGATPDSQFGLMVGMVLGFYFKKD